MICDSAYDLTLLSKRSINAFDTSTMNLTGSEASCSGVEHLSAKSWPERHAAR